MRVLYLFNNRYKDSSLYTLFKKRYIKTLYRRSRAYNLLKLVFNGFSGNIRELDMYIKMHR